jgi:hypothetical protein
VDYLPWNWEVAVNCAIKELRNETDAKYDCIVIDNKREVVVDLFCMFYKSNVIHIFGMPPQKIIAS